jgi:UPF0755 protein
LGLVLKLFLPAPVAEGLPPQTIRIQPGDSFTLVCDRLVEKQLVQHPGLFLLVARVMGLDRQLPAGEVTLTPGTSLWGVLQHLRQAQAITIDVTIPEGLQARQIAGLLQQQAQVDSAEFMRAVSNPGLIRRMRIDAPDLEGFLFPDTYNLYHGMSGEEVVRRMLERFDQVWDDSMTARADELGWTVRQALTMASIIEGEIMVPDEAPIVSSVYHNRLRTRMLLQADPTIQYIIPDGPRRLLKDDLKIESPYNTYLHLGLPPGPINNPGQAAILAALYPADTKYLFFVAKGDGTHAFNETERGHWRDKAKFQQVRRDVARNNKSK